MADKTRQIGGLHKHDDDNGTLYTLILFINNADIGVSPNGYTPSSVGKSVSTGQGGETYPVPAPGTPLLPAATYIYDADYRPVADHWVFTILACSDDYVWGTSGGSLPALQQVVNRSFSLKPLMCEYVWWGIIPFRDHYLYNATNTSNIIVYDNSRLAKSADDMVYLNAGVGDTLGSVTMQGFLTPFLSDGGGAAPTDTWILANAPVTWAGQNIPTIIYELDLYLLSSKNIWTYITWCGLNGSFSTSGTAPATPYDGTGMWRSVDQKLKEVNKGLSGTSYNLVTRHMQLVPHWVNQDLRWDATKNGGTWMW